jgi:hypothetical protein
MVVTHNGMDFVKIITHFLVTFTVYVMIQMWSQGARIAVLYVHFHFIFRPASWSSCQSFWLLIMRSRVRFSVLPWGVFLEVEDFHGDHGLGSLVELTLRPLLVLHIYISQSTSSGQRNCASRAFQPQKSLTFRPQPAGGGDHEVHKGHVVALKKKLFNFLTFHSR